jgi:HAE1 family hydrophobic/amphiphilic exporter-1
MTFNMISLGGLTIGIGMLVDNSIVVLESINRHFQSGKDATSAAMDGTKEVAASIAAGTITTLCVFVPMIFIKGVVGQIFKDLSLTICYSLAASLVVALTFVPMACAKLLGKGKKQTSQKRKGFISGLLEGWGRIIGRVEESYRRLIAWALDNRKKVTFVTLAVFVLTCVTIPLAGVEFMPSMDVGMVTVSVEMPNGSLLDETIGMIDKVTAAIDDIPEMEESFALVGSSGMSMVSSTDTATVYANLIDKKDRKRSADAVADDRGFADDDSGAVIDEELPPDGRARVDVDARDGVRLFGDDPGDERHAEQVELVRDALVRHREHTRIRENRLVAVPERRIAFVRGVDIRVREL